MEKFDVGDEVVIREREFLASHRTQSPTINSKMMLYAGCTTKIVKMIPKTPLKDYESYRLDIDGGDWSWRGDWLEPVISCVFDAAAFSDMF